MNVKIVQAIPIINDGTRKISKNKPIKNPNVPPKGF